jgi:hypothetical protein
VPAAPADTADAANLAFIDPGNIISDVVFYDHLSMDADAIQQFLVNKGSKCSNAEMPCLKNYRADTADQAADSLCAGYCGARQESAAMIYREGVGVLPHQPPRDARAATEGTGPNDS